MKNKRLAILFSIICSLCIVVILCSVIFSVQHVYECCTNNDSSVIIDGENTLGELVLANHTFKRGSSIFLVDKESARTSINKNVPIADVTSIKLAFPNRIYIYYRVLFSYFQIKFQNKYYIISENSKIIEVRDNAINQSQIVSVLPLGNLVEPETGNDLLTTVSGEAEVLSEILYALNAMDQFYSDVTNLFEFIDFQNEQEFIFLKTSTGVYFRLMGWDNIVLKMQAVLSVYDKKPLLRYEGTISVSDNLIPTHSFVNYYDVH